MIGITLTQMYASSRRFSDEFYRGFHLSNTEERGSTTNITIIDDENLFYNGKE
jgi:hypothetical protein